MNAAFDLQPTNPVMMVSISRSAVMTILLGPERSILACLERTNTTLGVLRFKAA
jgi:hypothetical protein